MNADRGDLVELLPGRHQQARSLVGTYDARWVRLEGHHHRRGAAFEGDTLETFEDLAMAAMNAIKVAECQDGLQPPLRPLVVGKVDYVHFWSGILENQPIIGQLRTRRQAVAGLRMRQVVTDVGEIRPLWRQASRDLERLRQAEVRRMRSVPQCVDHESSNALEQRPRLVRNRTAVGEVSEGPDAKPKDRSCPMHDGHRNNFRAPHGEW